MNILLRSLFVFVIFLLTIAGANAQASFSESDTIPTSIIYPKKNPFVTRPNYFQITKKTLPFYLVQRKVNYWKTTASFGINLNQAAFSDNWSSGGVNSIAMTALMNYKSEYKKDAKNLSTEFILQYGKLKNKGQMERKTNDRIFWDNKASLQMSKNWYFFGSLSFESQFDIGYTYFKSKTTGRDTATAISKFMAPGYLTESIGFEYKPVKYFSTRLGTGTARQTFMLDTTLYRNNSKNFGVPRGDKVKNELAFQIVSNLDKDIATNMNLKARYMMFVAYDKLSQIDHRLDATLTAKVNRMVNVTINGTALYDNNSGDGKIQSMQSLALGLVYKLPR
ncbi:hypothetical protein Pedsa_3095 [Pseudopedobacter saltans DSM 12145]|uniref:DUF3078 domain-containing protein n=1 Tax=Pseudopedobacter saltans (strain ATCC 51119 / DSM 12145 / JCM 21818 / CCUG 39354 / LMG 10337 / NBRC 100064 / NCIMB 13643) TaxID=762903 RepID=F0SA70_PSESL|nr:DUF3078 domain-containing protein [Pseudopedobacter saltans]ADY53634.1 hypothetical protein Pedsa_3095 [Pseudopedobacter saltans DSM 12145]